MKPAAAVPGAQTSPGVGSTAWAAGRGISSLGQRMPATPGLAGGHRSAGVGEGSRMELQTLLRRTKEASGDVLYIQEQFRFLQQSQPAGSSSRDERPPAPSGPGGAGGGSLGLGGGNPRL